LLIHPSSDESTSDVSDVNTLSQDDSEDEIPLIELKMQLLRKRVVYECKSTHDNCVLCGEFGPGGSGGSNALLVLHGCIRNAAVLKDQTVMCAICASRHKVHKHLTVDIHSSVLRSLV